MAKGDKVSTLPVVRVDRGIEPRIVMDVWGGEGSVDHVARYVRHFDDAIEISRDELRRGFLINMRSDAAWGDYEEFDSRKSNIQ